MQKLIKNVLTCKKANLKRRSFWTRLASGQSPDFLFVSCADSRVAPHVFTGNKPGDFLEFRNVGNIVSPFDPENMRDESSAAVLEVALLDLKVSQIIVCGHSECHAVKMLAQRSKRLPRSHLNLWLQHASKTSPWEKELKFAKSLSANNRLSQANVLRQIANLKTYPYVLQKLKDKKLKIYGWWFDIAKADIYCYNYDLKKFVLATKSCKYMPL